MWFLIIHHALQSIVLSLVSLQWVANTRCGHILTAQSIITRVDIPWWYHLGDNFQKVEMQKVNIPRDKLYRIICGNLTTLLTIMTHAVSLLYIVSQTRVWFRVIVLLLSYILFQNFHFFFQININKCDHTNMIPNLLLSNNYKNLWAVWIKIKVLSVKEIGVGVCSRGGGGGCPLSNSLVYARHFVVINFVVVMLSAPVDSFDLSIYILPCCFAGARTTIPRYQRPLDLRRVDFRVGSMSNRRRSEDLCYLGHWCQTTTKTTGHETSA